MKRRTNLLALLICGSLIVAACGSEGGTTDSEATPTTGAAAATASTESSPTTTTLSPTTTLAPTTTEAPDALQPVVPGTDEDVDAIVEMYAIVFDSSTDYQTKAAYIVEPEGLESTVETYASTGNSVGGVTAQVTAIAVAGDTAEVEYTLQFSGNPTYPGLSGTAVLTDAGWQVTRDMFCGIMASARSACPTS